MRVRHWASLPLFVALWACIQAAAASETVTGRVVAVADGDTLTLLDADRRQHRIRLDVIDAPEARQAFGDRSRQSLRELAHGRDAVADCPKVDKYQRQVCRVTIDGLDLGQPFTIRARQPFAYRIR